MSELNIINRTQKVLTSDRIAKIKKALDYKPEYLNLDTRKMNSEGSKTLASPLSEYSSIILDFYDDNYILSNSRREQLKKYISSGNPLICILNQFKGNAKFNNYTEFNSIFFNNENAFNYNELGSDYTLNSKGYSSIWKDYLEENYKSYEISLNENFEEKVNSLAYNSENNSTAFILKEYPNCYFLPWKDENREIFFNVVFRIIEESSIKNEPTDEWVKEYSFSNLQKVEKSINQVQRKIDELEDEKSKKFLEKENYEKIRDTLLFRDGKILEEVVKTVLIELGLEVKIGKNGREDLVFIFNGDHYIIEVKGCEKSASKKNVKQIASHVIEYTDEEDNEPKGILIINAWRKLPLEDRNTNDKSVFPGEIMKLVKLSKIVLITTQQLFVAYCDKLEGKFDLDEFMKKIDETNGILKGYDDIEKYKL